VTLQNFKTFKVNKCLHVRLNSDRNKWKSATGCYNTKLRNLDSIPGRGKRLVGSPQHLEAHQATYPMGTGASFLRDKAAGT
jgi:hypothetical protein